MSVENFIDYKGYKLREVFPAKSDSSQLVGIPVLVVKESPVPVFDAVIIAHQEGVLTTSQMMRNIFEKEGVSYFDPGERPELPDIPDKRLDELFIKPLIPTFRILLTDVRKFYNSQPMVDRYSFEQGDSDLERREWQKQTIKRYGEEIIHEEYDLKNQLSSNLMGKLQYAVDVAIRAFNSQEKYKDSIEVLKQMKIDLKDALLDYNQLPLDEKLAVVLFYEEQTKVFFDLLAGTVDPSEILNKKLDEDHDAQLVGAIE